MTRQVKLSLEEVRKNKFFVATPCYGGQLMEPYFRSTVKLMTFFNQHQIPLAFGTIANESLVTRARNVLLAYFLNSDYTHLLFIDADIEFQVEDVLKLYAADKDVVVGAYPKKGVAWQRIKENILAKPSQPLSDKDIAAHGSDYAVNFKFVSKETKTIAVENGLVKLHDAGTGFMMIKREAILKLLKAYPDLKYNNDVNINNSQMDDQFYALFDTMIDPIDKRYLSEDYTFCRRWQEIGGDIWLDPSISLNHYGHFCFQGNPNAIINWGEPVPLPPEEKQEVKTIDLPDEAE
jgi:hypothetical protein